jgi:hypothetical protein
MIKRKERVKYQRVQAWRSWVKVVKSSEQLLALGSRRRGSWWSSNERCWIRHGIACRPLPDNEVVNIIWRMHQKLSWLHEIHLMSIRNERLGVVTCCISGGGLMKVGEKERVYKR